MTRDVAAKLDGVPPVVLLATQMSTTRWGNTIGYRSSGPTPEGLYRKMLEGKAAPKDFFMKVKSSNWGVMEGYAVVDDKLGRSQPTANGGFEIRPHGPNDLPKKDNVVTLEKHPLTMSLRDIMADAFKQPPKYEFPKENNPDKNGILRFHQVGHANSTVNQVMFSINLNDPKAEKTITENVQLIASQFKPQMLSSVNSSNLAIKQTLENLGEKLDYSYPCYAQAPSVKEPVPVEVYGRKLITVRDVDEDFKTEPTLLSQNLMAEKDGFAKYFEPIDMYHGTEEEKFDASKKMITLMFKLNISEWKKYDEVKNAKIAGKGDAFNEKDIAHLMPLVPRFKNMEALGKFVITVGLGTPMGLYQAMEVNITVQKMLDSAKKNPQMDMDSFLMPATKNAALLAHNKEPLQIDSDMQARFYIQHPAESFNHHFTSDRGATVLVHKSTIAIAADDERVIKFLNSNAKGEHFPINPEWLGNKSGANVNAAHWALHYAANYDPKRDTNPEIHHAVTNYFEKNPGFVEREVKTFLGDKSKLDGFIDAHPKIKDMVSKPREIEQTNEERAKFRM
jgi:hypothetical protein